jgi:hypothetical protein
MFKMVTTTKVYQEADLSAPSIAELAGGDKVENIRTVKSQGVVWVEVKLPNGLQGYIQGNAKVITMMSPKQINRTITQLRVIFAGWGLLWVLLALVVALSMASGGSAKPSDLACGTIFLLAFSAPFWIAFRGLGQRKKYGLSITQFLCFWLIFSIIFAGYYGIVTKPEFG